MLDLYKNQYDRQTLKDNIYAVDFFDLLRTQKIDATFAVRYLLNKNYDLDDKYNVSIKARPFPIGSNKRNEFVYLIYTV